MTEKRHGSPTFYALLDEMAELHSRKSHDYANNNNPYGNYHFAGLVANLFSHSPQDAGFAGRLAEKIYRLSVLEGGRKIPKNESVDDSERDISVITALWMADRRDRRRNQTLGPGAVLNVEKSPMQQASEDACCKMIELEKFLTEADRQQMIDYLRACQRNANATEVRKSENPSQTR